jgi:hypothetical protein
MKLNNFFIYAENLFAIDIERLDLKYLSKYFNVKILYFNNTFKIKKIDKIKYLYFVNKKKFMDYLKKNLSKQSFILLANTNDLKFLYQLVKQCQKLKIQTIDISKTNLIPDHKLDFLLEFRYKFIKKIIFFYNSFFRFFFNLELNKKLSDNYINHVDYILFSGSFSEKVIFNQKAKKISTFSRDYQIFKNLEKKRNINKKLLGYAAFIDDGLGSHIDEKILKLNINKINTSLYYKQLNFFFAKLNKITRVVICPHPKRYDQKQVFKQNFLSEKKTIEVIKNSNFVIGTHSTALGLAVLLKKPILLITSKYYPITYSKIAIKKWKKTLGVRLIDISKKYKINNFNNLKINKNLYAKYKFEFHCKYKVLHKSIWDPFLKEIKII